MFLLIIFLCIFSLWPFYIEIRVAESVGLNPQRIWLAILVLFAGFCFLIAPKTRMFVLEKYREHKILFAACALYSMIRLISGVSNSSVSFFIAAYEVVSNILLMFVAMMSVRTVKDARSVFLALISCGLLVSVYAIFERQFEYNLFSQFADPETRAGFTAIMDKTRDGAYRAQSTFEHPLSLSQFLVIIAPLALIFYRSRRWFLISTAAFCSMVLAAFFTGSRSALVAPLGAVLVAVTVFAYHKYKSKGSGAGGFALMLIATLSLLFSLLVLPSLILGQGSQSQSASTATRFAQMQNGYVAIKNRPILGYGPGGASAVIMRIGDTTAGAQTIHRETTDNLFLTRVVESGIPSLVLYLIIIACVMRIGAREIYTEDKSERRLRVLLFLSVVSGALTMLVLSIFTVLPLLFVMFGVVLGLERVGSKGKA